MTEQKVAQSFFTKYKKWLIALVGIQLIPVLFLIILFGGGAVYLFINNDSNFHLYKSYIEKGYRAGHADGTEEMVKGKIPDWSLWDRYFEETDKLKEAALLEKEQYLAQFPESERGTKLVEMRTENIKLPLQLELEKRFKRGIDFYANYVKQRVNKEYFKSDEEYQEALRNEAWNAGYSYGYRTGLAGHNQKYGLSELKN